MDSDLRIRLSQHPNIAGAKFTCGNTGKLTRVASALDAKTPGHEGSGYIAFGGMADFTAQTLVSGGSGVIAGGANVFPRIVVRVWDLWTAGKLQEAMGTAKDTKHGGLGAYQKLGSWDEGCVTELLRIWRPCTSAF